MDNSLGLSGRPTGVEDEERILGAHDLDRADGRDLGALLVPPRISTLGPGDLAARSLEDENVLDQGALLERGVDDGLGRDRLSSSLALAAKSQGEPSSQHGRRWSRDGGGYALGSDDDLALAVDASVPERLGREPGEDDRVDGTDPRASQEGSRCLPGHGEIDRNLSSGEFRKGQRAEFGCRRARVGTYSVTLLDTPRLEDVGHPGDLSEELGVGDVDALSRLVGLVKDGGLRAEKGEKWSVQTPRV